MKNWQYIGAAGLKSLDNYGYHGVDNSFLGNNVLCHWWNFFINFFPLTMAPNLITLIGFLANIVSYLLYVYYCPTLTEIAPWYIYFVVGLLIFFYQSMDNIDGKQARRTKSSSPLGELFDHVCDASSLLLLISCIIVSLRGGKNVLMLSFVLTSIQFYLTHWEEYFTGVLLMGKWDGPTEGQILIILINFLQGFFVLIGYQDFWITQLGAGIRPVDIFVSVYVINSLLSIKLVFVRTFDAMKKKGKDFNSSILVLSPFTLFLVLSCIWYFTCNGILSDMEMRLYFTTISIIFGYLTSRLIVQRICHEKCVIFYPILIPLALIVVNNLLYHIGLNVISHLTGNWFMFLLSMVQFTIFSVSIIQQLTAYLKINCFTIPPVPVDSK